MKPIKIFLNMKHDNKKDEKDSIWETLKSPAETISKIILIVIAITPIVSVSLILSYLDSFHATVIGFSLFSNIASLGSIIIYSFGFLGSYFFIIFALPIFFGYMFGQNPISNNWNKIKDDFKSIHRQSIDSNELILILMGIDIYPLILICIYHIFLSIHFNPLFITEIICFVLFYICICLLYDLKEQKWGIFSGFYWLLLSCLFSFIFSFLVFLSNKSLIKYFFWLSLFNAFATFLFFLLGTSYAIARKDKTRKEDWSSLKPKLIAAIVILFLSYIFWLKIPFTKIVLRFSGIGNQNIIFVLKHDTPGCLKKQLINNKIKPKSNKNACVYPNKQSNPVASKKLSPKPTLQTKKLFLLIQTSNNYYIGKINKKAKQENKQSGVPPLNRLNSIIKLPKKYVWKIILQKN